MFTKAVRCAKRSEDVAIFHMEGRRAGEFMLTADSDIVTMSKHASP